MEIYNIRKSYGKNSVLNGVSFGLASGSCVGILGGNGSGKSTLMGILAGIIKPDGGAFEFEGVDLLKDSAKRQKAVGYVPQMPPLIEELSVRDNLRLWYDGKAMKKELCDGVLSMLGIDRFLNTPVRKLSGGMKKRVSIGCSVAHSPDILLLDEPGAALDLVCKDAISKYLTSLKNMGKTVLISTHDVQEIAICDKLFILKNGKLTPYIFDGDIHRLAGLL